MATRADRVEKVLHVAESSASDQQASAGTGQCRAQGNINGNRAAVAEVNEREKQAKQNKQRQRRYKEAKRKAAVKRQGQLLRSVVFFQAVDCLQLAAVGLL